MSMSGTESTPLLYIWLGNDPLAVPPDAAIDDTPGVSDLDLLAEAIAQGRLGTVLPGKIAISQQERPVNNARYRSIDLSRLLRDFRIPHRRCFEILSVDQ